MLLRNDDWNEDTGSAVDDNKAFHCIWLSLSLRMFAGRASRLLSTSWWWVL